MAGNVTGTDMRPDTDAYDKADVVGNVAKHLEKFGDSPIPEPPKVKADEGEPTPEPEPTAPAVEPEPTPEPEGDKAAEAIPDNYFRAAQHSGWEPDEIVEFHKANPELAMKAFKKLYEDSNNLSQEFAQLGRTVIAAQQQAKVKPPPEPAPTEVKDFVDIKKLREERPDDTLVDVIDALNKSLKEVVSQRQPQQPATPAVPTSTRERFEEDVAILQQLNNFFGAEEMDAYGEFYGSAKNEKGQFHLTWDHLTPGQRANRQAVLTFADQIIAGVEAQGRQIPVALALEKAHMAISHPITEQVIRGKIASQVTKRSKGITLKPSESKGVSETQPGGKKSDEQLLADTASRLANLRSKL